MDHVGCAAQGTGIGTYSPAARVAAVLATLLLFAGCTSESGTPSNGSAQSGRDAGKPNVVFVLTDDLTSHLVQYMPAVKRMRRDGVQFANYSVTDSLCCPSRASILTGRYPHNTGIFTNTRPDGGFWEFHRRGHERATIGTDLQHAGYRTGFLGKYLNGYRPAKSLPNDETYVPPGWDTWAVAGGAYGEYDYQLNENGTVMHYGNAPRDYLTDVLRRKAVHFIQSSAKSKSPFYLQVNTYAPHIPATPAPRHSDEFPNATVPRGPAFNEADLSDKPAWLREQRVITGHNLEGLDKLYRKRVQSVQAVDEMLTKIRTTLRRTGQARNTYVVFSSDNGFHMGQHRLMAGKQTAFETDVVVPLVVTGPGIPAGRRVNAYAANIDLRPTFADLAGMRAPEHVDGRSLAPLLHGQTPPWRTVSLIEHHGPNTAENDPDRQREQQGNPPTYSAIRTPEGTYVEYVTGERTYYDRSSDPHQLKNIYPTLSPEERSALHHTLTGLTSCQGGGECFSAARPR